MTNPHAREREIAAFYTARAHELDQRVRRHARGVAHATVEDACQNAWIILLRHPEVTLDDRGLAWLAITATREAWRLARHQQTERPAGAFRSSAGRATPGELPEPLADTRDIADLVADRIQTAQRMQDLALLKPRDRHALYLKGLGYSYREIQALTGGATYTAVNRRITEGRQGLHDIAQARDDLREQRDADA